MISFRTLVNSSSRSVGVRSFMVSAPVRKLTPDLYNPQVPKEVVSGAPDSVTSRVVRIYKPAKAATQSSNNDGRSWRIDWDIVGKSNRWENDLMGYQGTADVMNATSLRFDNKEAAIRFADGQGWDYYIYEPKERKFRKKDYSANFYHSAGPLKHIRTK
ncbi:ndufs4 NADH dehydrogenase Fe-S protein subunit [Yamadazyma tenuis]|uniref:NADH dehydrogenase [ubiquinone] iron-sulfur protein 4, mitochondrial n=1 Tax=Candida tenuis (strain ATCC 10573 / BCRC 21748 / CBS 615 / JCM 9827 / NBRC 10315 / NRRL Y-1498 / VKM Y-70) TaxID=590646 RepID=G3BF35_CANTC|nr:uncharacterized protein CANTEDRAFT_116695 [Yamadazyma tenuis ATCC 10573]EGV60623.1 hypothetical protein CANTEDRAFT_116695 [Yamadazyma tenuis ATCC 10573]WEJ94127.1 ndufs4 NADH dehydrogenase Fe-S protein subunit [Yamadazyma tenuis]